MRAIAAIVAGLLASLVVIILIAVIGLRATYAVPAGLDPYDGRQVIAWVQAMPAVPKLVLLASLFGGTLVGAALAKLIAGRAWAGWTVAGLITLYMAFSMLSLPLAGLDQALAIAGPIVGGLIGIHLVRARPAAVDEDAAATGDV